MRQISSTLFLLLLTALVLAFCAPVTHARLRLIPFGKRDEGTGGKASIPPGFDTKLAYITPTLQEVKSIYNKETTVADVLAGYRTQFTQACASRLNESSAAFSNHTTFGWFTFRRDNEQSDAVNDGVIVVKVACYECSLYDPTGGNPGQPITEETAEVIKKLDWTKDDVAPKGTELIKQFNNFVSVHNSTDGAGASTPAATNATTTPNTTPKTSSDTQASGRKSDEKPASGDSKKTSQADSPSNAGSKSDGSSTTNTDNTNKKPATGGTSLST